jgi:hypothetical protein
LLRHPSLVCSTNFDESDDSIDGSDRSSVIRDLDRSYTTVSELHGQEEWLWSSLEAVEVALASAHRERVVAQAQLAGNYCYNCF